VPVVYFTDRWDIGEVKNCQTQPAKEHDEPNAIPSKDMVCSMWDYDSAPTTLGAKIDSGLVSKDGPESIHLRYLFDDPAVFSVAFKGSGNSSVFKSATDWKCRRTVDGLLCE
jgi:hypothetical protein